MRDCKILLSSTFRKVCLCNMPKHVKSDAEWKARLRDYAAGNFKFGQGQKPPRTSRWATEIGVIDKCPAIVSTKNLFGVVVTCTCGHHVSPSTTPLQPKVSKHSAIEHQDLKPSASKHPVTEHQDLKPPAKRQTTEHHPSVKRATVQRPPTEHHPSVKRLDIVHPATEHPATEYPPPVPTGQEMVIDKLI